MKHKRISLVAAAVSLFGALASANPSHQPLDDPLAVGVFPAGNQGTSTHDAAIAFDAAGNSVVVFGSTHSDIWGDPYFQRFDAEGNALGAPVLVNPTLNSLDYAPSVAMAPSGDFVVVWQSNGPDGDNFGILARAFHADGTPKGNEFIVNEVTAGGQDRPSIVMDALGNFAVTWGTGYPDKVLSLRTFHPDGTPRSAEVSVTGLARTGISPAMLPSGDLLITWGVGTPSFEIMGRCYDLDANPRGPEFMVNDQLSGNQMYPFTAASANGEFVALFAQSGSPWTIQFRRFDANGTPLSGQFEVGPTYFGEPVPSRAAMTATGGLVVTWHGAPPNENFQVFARAFDSDNTPLTGVFQANTATGPGGERYPSVAISDHDSFAYTIAWSSAVENGSAGTVFTRAYGCPNSPPVADAGQDVAAECDSAGGAVVTLDGTGSLDPDGDVLDYQWHVAEDEFGIPFAILDDPTSPTPTGTFPLGETLVTLVVTDPAGEVAVDDVLVTVSDTAAPTAVCTTDLAALWPPNHELVTVAISVVASDDCAQPELLDVQCRVSSCEPDDANGDGEFIGDVDGEDGYTLPVEVLLVYNPATETYEGTVELRAERDGGEGGRTYSIVTEVTDPSGNTDIATCVVAVPHDRRKNK